MLVTLGYPADLMCNCARCSVDPGAFCDAPAHFEGQFQCHIQEDPGTAYWEGGELWTPEDL